MSACTHSWADPRSWATVLHSQSHTGIPSCRVCPDQLVPTTCLLFQLFTVCYLPPSLCRCLQPYLPMHNIQVLLFGAGMGGELSTAEAYAEVFKSYPERFGPTYMADGGCAP